MRYVPQHGATTGRLDERPAVLPAGARHRSRHGAGAAQMGIPRRCAARDRPARAACRSRAAGSRAVTRCAIAWERCRERQSRPACARLRRRARARRVSDPVADHSTAGRWSIWTAAASSQRPLAVLQGSRALRDHDACQRASRRAHAQPAGPPMPTSARARPCDASSMHARCARSCSCAARPRPSIWWPTATVAAHLRAGR